MLRNQMCRVHHVYVCVCALEVEEGSLPTTSTAAAAAGRPQPVGAGPSTHPSTSTPPSSSIPFMLTAAMKHDLLQLGYSEPDLYKMPPDIAHQILRAKLRKRNKPPSYTTRPPSIPQHPQPSEDDDSDDVPFSPWAIGGCVLLTVVMLVVQFATVS
ncbi:hypothetical protein, variant [Aphanomyces astaci]|uniref:Uncharacterized protein n=1 Tax=Aphanomyces astaci TaxID=112090 RepID=W4G910_APHAT|nr:hypothetical protein, variant [Aphanomyces astaci]ETV76177.1 hypothetical protein, variant [Aphanomyces astaci]|eukprot:XP_009834302.1 hypothetical protein, variant [Aphanomyces astaci]